MNAPARARSLRDLDPLPTLPHEAAECGWSALLLGLGVGTPLRIDPHRAWKMANFDRLLFDKMPVLCSGGAPLQVAHSWQARPLVLAEVPNLRGAR